jgi:hypothetical protein
MPLRVCRVTVPTTPVSKRTKIVPSGTGCSLCGGYGLRLAGGAEPP